MTDHQPAVGDRVKFKEIPSVTEQLLTRFMALVEKTSECWNWRLVPKSSGYGYFRIGESGYVAHRIAYTWLVGPIPEPLELDHLCRNKVCVNPEHLEPVTHAENILRASPTSRVRNRHTCRNGLHPWPESAVSGGRARGPCCGPCKREATRQSDARRRAARKARSTDLEPT